MHQVSFLVTLLLVGLCLARPGDIADEIDELYTGMFVKSLQYDIFRQSSSACLHIYTGNERFAVALLLSFSLKWSVPSKKYVFSQSLVRGVPDRDVDMFYLARYKTHALHTLCTHES